MLYTTAEAVYDRYTELYNKQAKRAQGKPKKVRAGTRPPKKAKLQQLTDYIQSVLM